MKTPLRILHLEDDPIDADLVESIFQEERIVTEIVFRLRRKWTFMPHELMSFREARSRLFAHKPAAFLASSDPLLFRAFCLVR